MLELLASHGSSRRHFSVWHAASKLVDYFRRVGGALLFAHRNWLEFLLLSLRAHLVDAPIGRQRRSNRLPLARKNRIVQTKSRLKIYTIILLAYCSKWKTNRQIFSLLNAPNFFRLFDETRRRRRNRVFVRFSKI